MSKQKPSNDFMLHIKNIGGIDEASVEFSPSVTALVGRNATNRTSLLNGLMAALGSDSIAMKSDADKGKAELVSGDEASGDEAYTRRLMRRSGDVVTDGKPYLDDPTLPDLFAFLLESNEARQAVARADDLRQLILRPVDTDAIEAEINRLVTERRELKKELNELDSLKDNLPNLEEKRTRLRKQLSEKKSKLQAKEEELESIDADVEETREEKAEVEEKLKTLREKRSELDDVRYDLETERERLESLQAEQEELETELESIPKTPTGDIDEIDSQIQRLRDQKQDLEAEINSLQNVVSFNEKLLNGEKDEVFDELGSDIDTEGQVTSQLLNDNEVTCWTCRSTVDTGQIKGTIDHLRELSQQKLGQVNGIDEEISELQEERRELEQAQRERDRIDRELSKLDRETSESEDSIQRLQERRETLTEEIETIEATVEDREDDDYSEILDLHREANQLEYGLGRLEGDLDDVNEKIASIEDRLAQEDGIEAQLEEIRSEIESLRTRIERLEQSAIEQFNDHMEDVLELLEYRNLDRIWLERVERDTRDGRQKVTKSIFELHIIRSTEGGVAYEDTVDHLSESEREVVGLVFALAGYLAHEVHEQVPFMLLDSLEAIDAERLATLIDYLKDYAEYLIVALLPEDATALPEEYDRVTDI